jgi:hypothetical protein
MPLTVVQESLGYGLYHQVPPLSQLDFRLGVRPILGIGSKLDFIHLKRENESIQGWAHLLFNSGSAPQ